MRVAILAAVIALSVAGVASSSPPKHGCGPAQTTAIVKRFLQAFNEGDWTVLNNRVWGGRLYFNWYAVTADPGSRIDAEARRRETLMSYFAARHAVGERLVLTKLKLNGITAGTYRNFEFRLLRSANDLRAARCPTRARERQAARQGDSSPGRWEPRSSRS